MTSMGRSLPILMTVFSLTVLQIYHSATAAGVCRSLTLPSGKSFEHCDVLPALDATLHWTYDAGKSTLSIAFAASPPTADGWVAFGLNPDQSGMIGTQALIAGKFGDGAAVTADTYDIKSYHAVIKGPISYNVTGISAEQNALGKTTIMADWKIPAGVAMVNQVWQVGPIEGGKPGKHSVETPNLSSRSKLSLNGEDEYGAGLGTGADSATPGSPAGAPEAGPASGESHGTEKGSGSEPAKATTDAGAGEALFFCRSLGLGLVAIVVYSLI